MSANSNIYVRDDLSQLPTQAKYSSCESPDIILYGQKEALDTSIFTSSAGYATDFGSNVLTHNDNYVYLRGYNKLSEAQTGYMYLFFCESDLLMWPQNWRSDCITVAGTTQNWTEMRAAAPSAPCVAQVPLLWNPSDPAAGSHFCTVSWASTSSGKLDVMTILQENNVESLSALLSLSNGLGWRNTVDVVGSPPSLTGRTSASFLQYGGQVYLTVQFIDMPNDGTFNLNLVGSNPQNSISIQNAKLSDFQGGVNSPLLSYPPNFTASATVDWFKGVTNPPPTAQINVSMVQLGTERLFNRFIAGGIPLNKIPIRMFQTNYIPSGIPSSSVLSRPTPVVLVGSQQWNLRYGQSEIKPTQARRRSL